MEEVVRLVDPPKYITCVDCGNPAGLLDRLDDGERVEVGTILSYRCTSCMDRWDIEIGEEE